ncbi:MAG: spore coat protein CotJB [Clostridium sp.]|uniref:spore coat protein CotJB n=1 Tax=Clostridium sp. TaxID=1506 RepID=UPI002A8689C2|nr:spore coat protein CotJB [Clostridium sp.]MDY5097902.1 spore coat protein CotJB [Clostridium sp.]
MCEEKLLDEIKKYQFYAVELNLYLDNFPNSREALSDYKRISAKLDLIIKKYEERFGPLRNFGDASREDSLSWTIKPWPWENY